MLRLALSRWILFPILIPAAVAQQQAGGQALAFGGGTPVPGKRAVSGRVLLGDTNEPPPEPVAVELHCPTLISTAWTDPGGKFSMPLRSRTAVHLKGCSFQGHVPAYERVLAGENAAEGLDAGTLRLQPKSKGARFMLSPAAGEASATARQKYIEARELWGRDGGAALAKAEEALKRQPRFAAALHFKGQVLEMFRRRAEARAAYEAAAAADPRYAWPLIDLASMAADDGRFEDAARWAGAVNRLAPEAFPLMYLTEAAAALTLGRTEDAERVARRGLTLAGASPGLHGVLGMTLFRRGDCAGALAALGEFLKRAPQSSYAAEARAAAAECRRKTGTS